MKRFSILLLVMLLVFGCILLIVQAEGYAAEKEQYYWIASFSTNSLFLFNDYPTLKQEADIYGVDIHFTGPTNLDIEMQNNMLEQLIVTRPAGILFMPFGEGHNSIIDKCIDQGIPLVCIDGDAPNSKRICYSGTDWVELGRIQARTMADLLNGKGTVMLSAIVPNDNTLKARRGIEEELAKYPDINIFGLQNDLGQTEEAARLTAAAIQAHPEINGFIGINAFSGPGISRAVIEAGKVGEIKIVCVDNTPDIIEAVKKNVIQASIVQKREAFEAWGFRVLYAYNHPVSPVMAKYKEIGLAMVPKLVLTGVLVMTPDNIDEMMEVLEFQKKVSKEMGY